MSDTDAMGGCGSQSAVAQALLEGRQPLRDPLGDRRLPDAALVALAVSHAAINEIGAPVLLRRKRHARCHAQALAERGVGRARRLRRIEEEQCTDGS